MARTLTALEFSPPRSGWIELRLTADDERFLWVVSYIPTDSLSDLTLALCRLCQGSKRERVEWSHEPEYSTWTFRDEDDELTLEIDYPGEDPILIGGATTAILALIFRSLSRLGSEPVWQPEEWSFPFPHRDLGELRELLRARRGQSADE